MPRKQTAEEEYDPIKAEVARSVTSHVRGGEPVLLNPAPRVVTPAPAQGSPAPRSGAQPLPEEQSTATPLPLQRERPRPAPARERAEPVERRPRRSQSPREESAQAEPAQRRATFKHFKVTEDEDLELMGFVQRLQQKSRSKVTFSIIARSLFLLAMHAEEELTAEITKGPHMPRPGNEDEERLAEYEELWLQKLSGALRRSRPFQVGLPRQRPE